MEVKCNLFKAVGLCTLVIGAFVLGVYAGGKWYPNKISENQQEVIDVLESTVALQLLEPLNTLRFRIWLIRDIDEGTATKETIVGVRDILVKDLPNSIQQIEALNEKVNSVTYNKMASELIVEANELVDKSHNK